jgi:hypothetical protein
MSMDLFLTCVRDGEPSDFPRALFEEVMGRGATDPKFPLSEVLYADGGCREIDGGGGDTVSSLSFAHFGGDTFFDRLWELADRSASYLLWPGESPSVAVTRPDVLSKLDPKMVKDLGAVVVGSGKELSAAIEDGFDLEDDEDFDEE